MTFRDKIENTMAFKGLNKVQREVTLKRQNRGVIENGFHVAMNLGLEQWERQTQYNYINSKIIKELVINENK